MWQKTVNGGSGGGGTETVLWTNTSSSSNFSTQTITLGHSISDFRYIGIVIKDLPATSDTSSNNITFYATPDDVRKSVIENGKNVLAVGSRSSASWFRYFTYTSDTSITVSTAYKLNAAGTTDAAVIPIKIIGIS